MSDLPTMNRANQMQQVIAKATKPKHDQPSFATARVDVPILENVFEGYFSNRLDIKLTTRQQSTLKSILFGLQSKFAKLENGKDVSNAVDAVKWILENVR